MSAVVVVPWRADPERAHLWDFVSGHLAEVYPEFRVFQSGCSDGPFNRAECIVRAALACPEDVLVVYDADVILDGDLRASVERVAASERWSVPHWHLRRLTPEATAEALSGVPLSPNMPTMQKPYKGNSTGTLVVIHRDLVLRVPPDVRFKGWGQEDEAWGTALTKLAGPCHRGSHDLYHLWHTPAERLDRRFGNEDGKALIRRYEQTCRFPKRLKALVEESKTLWKNEWYAPADAGN